MTAANGCANGSALNNPRELVGPTVTPSAPMSPSTGHQFSTDQIKERVAELEVPVEPSLIEWRGDEHHQVRKAPGTGYSVC